MTVPPSQISEAVDMANIETVETDARWVSLPEEKSNVLEDLRSNIDRLGELHNRLQFMMGEIKSLIR